MKKIGNHNLSMDMNTNKEESLKDSPRIHERKIIGKKLNSQLRKIKQNIRAFVANESLIKMEPMPTPKKNQDVK